MEDSESKNTLVRPIKRTEKWIPERAERPIETPTEEQGLLLRPLPTQNRIPRGFETTSQTGEDRYYRHTK